METDRALERNILKTPRRIIAMAPQGAERQVNATDEQDIRPDKAQSGGTTDHQHTRKCNEPPKKKRGPKHMHPRNKAGWMPNKYGGSPYKAQLNEYLHKTEEYYQPSTRIERERKFYLVAETMIKLGAPPNVLFWTRTDIMRWKKHIEKNIQNSTSVKYWRYLTEILEYYKNDSLRDMLRERELRIPKVPPKELHSLTQNDVQAIRDAVQTMEGWEGDIARFVTVFYPYTGLRPSELRTEKLSDVNIETWSLVVSNPKGVASYGRKRTVPIPEPARQPLLDFLEARKKYILKLGHNPNTDILIPCKHWRVLGVWPDARWRSFKRMISQRTNVKFSWQVYRSTFCQWAIDRGASLQAVSKIMGHSTSSTTEKHYGRIQDSKAVDEVNRILSEPTVASKKTTA
jgi:integrase